MADTKSKAQMLADHLDRVSPWLVLELQHDERQQITAELRRLDAENAALADSCAAKADRIDRLVEAVERLTAERDALRAELAFEHMTLAHDVKPFKAHELLRRVVTCLASEYRTHKRPRHVFWAEVSSATALGSNCSAGLARWAGFDPDTGKPLT